MGTNYKEVYGKNKTYNVAGVSAHNLLRNAKIVQGIYGTATWEDIVTVCGAAIGFGFVMGLIVFGVVQLLLI